MSVADTPERTVAPGERTERSPGAARRLALVGTLAGSAVLLVAGIAWGLSIGSEISVVV